MMKLKIVLLIVGASFVSCRELLDKYDFAWEEFKEKYNKLYYTDEEDDRRAVWEDNMQAIELHNVEANMGHHSYKLGLHEYADLTTFEMRKAFNGYVTKVPRTGDIFSLVGDPEYLPKEVDWRKKGFVTSVKNQENCGSCWAFSATGSLEGQHRKATGNLTSLSEQNLIDCSSSEGNDGCSGGSMDQAFKYIVDNKGIDTENSYPYMGEDQQCRFKSNKVGATLRSWVDIPAKDEAALQLAVAIVGPVSIAIDASSFDFQFYKEGVYDNPYCSETELDHGVLVIGYGTENGEDYWLVKNSWGTTWGDEGYIKMTRNKNNQCGIASQASFPTV